MTPRSDFISNFEYLKLNNIHLYNLCVECEDSYHNNPKVSIFQARTASEKLLHAICDHQKLPKTINYFHEITFQELTDILSKRSYLSDSQEGIIHILRRLGNDAAHGKLKPRNLSTSDKKIINKAANAIYTYEPSWKNSLSQTLVQILFDLTKSLADVAGYPSTSKHFEAPPDIFRNLIKDSKLKRLEIDKIKSINADLEKSQLDYAYEIGIFKEATQKQKKLYQLWDAHTFDRKSFLREISSFSALIDHDTNALSRIKKWLEENPTEILSATNEQHRVAREQWIQSDIEAVQIAKEQSAKIDKLQDRIIELKNEGKRYQNWVTEYPVKMPKELEDTLWKRRSDFFKQRMFDMRPPFEEYFGIPQKIGEGGWGTAYKCSPKEGIRYVAKIVRGDLEPSKIEHIERIWQKEARIATKLTLLDRRITGIAYPIREGDKDHLGLTMYEYIEGESLSTYLNRNPVPLPKALLWITKVADTVFELRHEDIWFTDLGFENIIIRDGMPVLIDPTPLQPGRPMGNSSWPPEWSSDHNIDLFSNDFIPASGQLFQLAWLLLSMICPQKSKNANYLVKDSSMCSIRGETPTIDEKDLNENNKQTARDCVNYAIEKLPQKHREYIKDRKEGLVAVLISCIDINPDRRNKYTVEDFNTPLLNLFDPFGVYQSTY